MRLGVLDVGSNTIHLQVMDAHPAFRYGRWGLVVVGVVPPAFAENAAAAPLAVALLHSPDSAPTATSIYCPDNQACKCAPSGVSVRALLCGPSWGVWQWVSGLRE